MGDNKHADKPRSELLFDFTRFRYDLMAYRNGVLRMGRRPFGELVGDQSNGTVICHIEMGHNVPKLELFWNICKVMKQDPAIYFIEQ